MSGARDDGICAAVLERIDATVAATLPTRRVTAMRVVAVARYLNEWSRRRDGMRVCDSAVSQIAAGTLMGAGTVRNALAILEAAGAVETLKHGGNRGIRAVGATRRLRLSEVDSLRATDRAEWTVVTTRDSDVTTRDQSRDSALTCSLSKEARGRAHERWADDDDVTEAPPPIAATIAAIRARLGNAGSPWMDAMIAREGPFAEVAVLGDRRIPPPGPPPTADPETREALMARILAADDERRAANEGG